MAVGVHATTVIHGSEGHDSVPAPHRSLSAGIGRIPMSPVQLMYSVATFVEGFQVPTTVRGTS